MQDKTTLLETTSAGTGLKINRKKTELMKMNTTANTPVTVGGEPIREVESLVWEARLTDREAQTDTPQPELARQEQLSSCSSGVRHGGQHRRHNKRSRHSSTPVWYCGGSEAGFDTPSGSQHPALHAKPWPETPRGRGRQAGLATVGGETLKQSWNSKGPTGLEWPEQRRTECDGVRS